MSLPLFIYKGVVILIPDSLGKKAESKIKEWLDKHSVQELMELVKAVNDGEDFYVLYSQP